MKKLIAILVIAIVMVGAVFAASGDTLTLTSTVAPHEPGFKIFGSETAISGENAGTEGIAAGASVGSTVDISLNPITIYCRVKQYSPNGNYDQTKCKFKGVATIYVTATALKARVDSVDYSTNGVANEVAAANVTIPNNGISNKAIVREQSEDGYANDTVKITLTYDGKTVQDSAVYADFSFTWAASDDLPPATYNADITMTYEVE